MRLDEGIFIFSLEWYYLWYTMCNRMFFVCMPDLPLLNMHIDNDIDRCRKNSTSMQAPFSVKLKRYHDISVNVRLSLSEYFSLTS